MYRSPKGRFVTKNHVELNHKIASVVFCLSFVIWAGYVVGYHLPVANAQQEMSLLASDYVTPSVSPSTAPSATPTNTPTPSPVASTAPSRLAAVKSGSASESASLRFPTDRQVWNWINQYDWDVDIAYKLAKSENAWNFTRSFDCHRTYDNGTSIDRGIFQINNVWQPQVSDVDAFNCEKNIEAAYDIYLKRGKSFNAWTAYNNGSWAGHSTDIND